MRLGMNAAGLSLLIGLTLLTPLANCTWNNPPRTNIVPPCGRDGVSRIELGRPFARPAQFNGSGGVLYATAYDFGPRGIGEPEVGSTLLYIGQGTLDDFQPGTNPKDPLLTVQLVEDDFNTFEVPAGTYWVVSSNDADIAIVSCEAEGVSAVAAAP